MCVILYMVHSQALLWREANESHSRSLIIAVTLEIPPACSHFNRTEQLLSEHSLACQYHIDDKDPTLLMHITSLVSQVPYTRYFLVSCSQNQKFLLIKFRIFVAFKDISWR